MEVDDKMFLEERRMKILNILNQKKSITISTLASMFSLGEATIRRDLISLENQGAIIRTHGGAILADRSLEEAAHIVREHRRINEKKQIANTVASLIRDGEALMIDGGSTCFYVVQALKSKNNLVIVTNSTKIADEIGGIHGNQVILTGGEFRRDTNALVGPVAVEAIRQFRVDHVILGMSSMTLEDGFFTVNSYEAEVKRAMIASGRETIVAMDSSKVNKYVFSFVCNFSKVNQLVIDDEVAQNVVDDIVKRGVDVKICPVERQNPVK